VRRKASRSTTTRRPPSTPTDPYRDHAVLNEVATQVCQRGVEELFERLGVRLRRSGKRYTGPCPIHGGRSPVGFNLYPEGETAPGYWVCYSNHCDHYFPRGVIGFIRGVISHQDYGWLARGDPECGHREAVDFALDFLGTKIGDIQADRERAERTSYFAGVEYLTRQAPAVTKAVCDREQFRRQVQIPARYYLDRGYSREILDAYDVGEYRNPKSKLDGRIAVPVYDLDHRMVLGVIGRSVNERCPRCKMYHPISPCPRNFGQCPAGGPKWECSEGFIDKHHIYNMWKARHQILATRCCIVVEGPGDVWRCEEAGLKNAVALMGSDVTDAQQWALESCGATTFVVLTDEDDAGRVAAEQIERKFGDFAHVHRLGLPAKDVGDMSVDQVRRGIVPFVESKTRRKK
jgi:hypothetical protein